MDSLRQIDTAIEDCGQLLDECRKPIGSPKPKSYRLLRKYGDTARISSLAHKHAEVYYRRLNKMLLISLMVLTTTGSVIISVPWIDSNHIVSKIIAYLVTIIGGVITILKPAERFTQHNSIATEYNDVATDIEQILATNGLTRSEISDANHMYLSKLQIWDGLAPPLSAVFISQAKRELTLMRPIESSNRKKTRVHL